MRQIKFEHLLGPITFVRTMPDILHSFNTINGCCPPNSDDSSIWTLDGGHVFVDVCGVFLRLHAASTRNAIAIEFEWNELDSNWIWVEWTIWIELKSVVDLPVEYSTEIFFSFFSFSFDNYWIVKCKRFLDWSFYLDVILASSSVSCNNWRFAVDHIFHFHSLKRPAIKENLAFYSAYYGINNSELIFKY